MIARIRRGWKALTQMVFGPGSRSFVSQIMAAMQQGEARPAENSIVQATIGWLARNFPEAPLRVLTRAGTELTPAPDHRMLGLIHRPNPYYSGILLWSATIASFLLTGNGYWIKVRSAVGLVVQLWWVPSHLIEPAVDQGSAEFITHYNYNPDARYTPIRLDPSDVVHFRYGLDPQNPRLGCSPLMSVLREVMTDDQAAGYALAILRNMGVPGVVISPDEDNAEIGPAAAEKIKTDFATRFGADNRGSALVLSGKSKIQVLSFDPQQMDLKTIRRVPEERISAVLGVPAIVVGLGAGLEHATMANYAEAREAGYENGIIPMQRLLAEELRVQLLSDFGDINRMEVDFDLSKVRVLQTDQNALTERLTRALLAGGMTLNRYLRETGQDELGAAGEVLYVPTSVLPTPITEIVPEPTPVPAPNGRVPVAA